MTCKITIHAATIIATPGNEGDVVKIEVEGDVEGCEKLQVWVEDSNSIIIVQKVEVQPTSNGHWTVTFFRDQHFGKGIRCGDKTVFRAKCTKSHDGEKCEAFVAIDLPCKPNGGGEPPEGCPEVDITITPPIDCVGGRRTVHFRAEVRSANDATYTWFFGTDEDNQPGEDNQAGDGSGNAWLPAPNSDGVRIVETDHVYDPTSDQPQTITVRLVTSSGPNSTCTAEKEFTLEPCQCDFTVSVEVKIGLEELPLPTNQCFPPGDYIVEATVTSPTGNNIVYKWSVDGTNDSSQTTNVFEFSIDAGEEKTITVFAEQGSCDGSSGLTVRGCEDCSNYDVQLRVLGTNRENVTEEDCLPPGDYTVQATSPTGAGNTFKWLINNVEDTTATGTTLQVNLGNDDEKIVTLEASRGECRDMATVVLETCPPEENGQDGEFIPCLLFKLLALLGLGFVFLGAILLLCPAVGMPLLPPPAAAAIGIALLVGGGILLALGLLLWVLICEPDACDWFAFLWQALILLGLLMIYAAFCPVCSWMLLGIVPLILGAFFVILWGRNCDVTRCGVLAEVISLFTFVVNVVVILEMVLAACVVTSHPVATVIWGAMIAAFQAWLWFDANQNNCIQD